MILNDTARVVEARLSMARPGRSSNRADAGLSPASCYAFIEVATLAHIRELAPQMRRAEIEEVQAAFGLRPAAVLLQLMRDSARGATPFGSRAVFFDGELATIFGVIEMHGLGFPWLLSCDAANRYPMSFWRTSKAILAELRKLYPALLQYVDARYTQSISWAKRLGFHVGPAKPHGAAGLPFHLCVMHGVS